jgi:tRNA threonylcarbamoyladenosine dehydratase
VSQGSFVGVGRLYGTQAAARLQSAHVLIVGIGGVGSWAVEALARSAIGRLTLVDLDVIAHSNINRQIHALEDTLGANKVDVMKARVAQINPLCQVTSIDDFMTLENLSTIMASKPDFVIDAIDVPRVKAALIAYCVKENIGIAVAGAAGGRDEPLALHETDVALCKGDALLSNLRARLRRDYGFNRELGKAFGVIAVASKQLALPANKAQIASNTGAALNCAGYGSTVTVTATMGMALAAVAIRKLSR